MCACPGEVLTYTCTVVGGARDPEATIWGGSAFDCAGNEVILRHSNFDVTQFGECNNGAIQGRSVGVNGMCFTSQLNVTVSAGLNNKTVMCFLDSAVQRTIGESLIRVASKYIYLNSYKINIVGLYVETFVWGSITLDKTKFPISSIMTFKITHAQY